MTENSTEKVGVASLEATQHGEVRKAVAISDGEYAYVHSDVRDNFLYGGRITENGVEDVQVMMDNRAVRFDADTLDVEYHQAH